MSNASIALHKDYGEPQNIIDILLLNENTLLIIQPTLIRRCTYSPLMQLENVEVIAENKSWLEKEEYNIAGYVYWEPLLNKKFILLLKDNGTLVIRNTDLERVDSIETGVDQTLLPRHISFDERNERVYINLADNAIYSISYHKAGDSIFFTKDSNNPKCIYEAPEQITNFETSWHVDLQSGREFITIAALLSNDDKSQTYLEVIRQSRTDSWRKELPWESLIDLTLIIEQEVPTFSDTSSKTATLKAVPNIGFFIFSLSETFFFALPLGPEQTLGGSQIVKYISCPGLSFGHELFQDGKEPLRLQPQVILRQSSKGLEFTIFTDRTLVLQASLELIFEHPEENSYHWGELLTECFHVCEAPFQTTGPSSIEGVTPLEYPNCLLWGRVNGIMFINLSTKSLINSLDFAQPSAFYSSMIGYEFPKSVVCAGFRGNKGAIETEFFGYKDVFLYNEEIQAPKGLIAEVWLTKKCLWWRTDNGRVERYGGQTECLASDIIHVAWNDQLLRRSHSIETATNIWDDQDGNYAFITHDGFLKWSNNAKFVESSKFKEIWLTKHKLFCIRLQDASLLTAFSVNAELTILRDAAIIKEGLNLSSELDTISSIFIMPTENNQLVVIGSNDGTLCILDLNTFMIVDKIKIGYKNVKLCGVPESSCLLIYTEDDLIILTVGKAGKYELKKVETTFRISFLCARNASEILAFGGRVILSYRLSNDIGKPTIIKRRLSIKDMCPTKFVSFNCSNRFIVTTASHSDYSVANAHYVNSAHLLLLDIELQENLYHYDLSEKYPQAVVSDIAAIPYEAAQFHDDIKFGRLSFAEQQTLSRCFVVSLSYETAEDDSLDNLLVFSIDDNGRTLDFHVGLNTRCTITVLSNYYNNMFLVAGEVLQVYQVNYVVQENAFKVLPISNSVSMSGYPHKIAYLSSDYLSSELTRKHSVKVPEGRVTVLNLTQGFQEYNISVSSNANPSKITGHLRLSPVSNTNREMGYLDACLGKDRIIVDFSKLCTSDNKVWCAIAFSDCYLEIYHFNKEELSAEKQQATIKFASQITSVTSLLQRTGSSIANSEFISQKPPQARRLFSISTTGGQTFIFTEEHLRSDEVSPPRDDN